MENAERFPQPLDPLRGSTATTGSAAAILSSSIRCDQRCPPNRGRFRYPFRQACRDAVATVRRELSTYPRLSCEGAIFPRSADTLEVFSCDGTSSDSAAVVRVNGTVVGRLDARDGCGSPHSEVPGLPSQPEVPQRLTLDMTADAGKNVLIRIAYEHGAGSNANDEVRYTSRPRFIAVQPPFHRRSSQEGRPLRSRPRASWRRYPWRG